MTTTHHARLEYAIETIIFGSRFLQIPIYLGLIIAQLAYTYTFGLELYHLVAHTPTLTESEVIIIVLGLVDVAMVANLLQMIVIGGYSTFVSKLEVVENHADKPEWLGHIDPSIMKVKLGMALIGISSIHLLRSFIDAGNVGWEIVWKQLAIHGTFVVSTLALAAIDWLSTGRHRGVKHEA